MKLNDRHLVLLTTASQRDDGSLLPVPETLTSPPADVRKALQALTKKGLAVEIEVGAQHPSWREEEDRRLGLVISDAGRAAIRVNQDTLLQAPEAAPQSPQQPNTAEIRPGTKQALLLELTRREGGASIAELVEATGWLPHTVRAAITGLRKRGHNIVVNKVDGASGYRCTPVAG
jgi:hypothetical protein